MATINALYEKLKSLNLPAEVPKIIERTKFDIKNKVQSQLLHGLNGEGKTLKIYRSKAYAEKKNRQNSLPGFGIPDLRLTGATHRSIFVKVNQDSFDVEASDGKVTALLKKYGENVLKLNKESKTAYSHGEFAKALQNYITGKTGLMFI